MNYIGHKASAVAMFPLMVMYPLKYEGNINNEYIHLTLSVLKNIFYHFYELAYTKPYLFLFSIIFFWIGSTVIDFIDFKIIKKFMPEHKQKFQYYYHRQWTHGFGLNLFFLILLGYLLIFHYNPYYYLLLFLSLGIWTHLIVDMLSGSIPIGIYGNYNGKMKRIGINRVVPKSLHYIFSKKVPKFVDWSSPLLFFIGGMLFMNLNGMDLIYNPIMENLSKILMIFQK